MKRQVVLADDHQLLIDGIKAVVEEIENTTVATTVNSGTELLNYLDRHKADLVILDLNMPGQDGLKCLHIIKQLYPSTKVLVLTSYNQPELMDEARKRKADGYLVKNTSSALLKDVVNAILNGQEYFPPKDTVKPLAESSPFFDEFLRKYQLTKREVDIIRLICREMSSKQIAAELFLSEFTVTTHRKNIFRKLDIKNVAGLINFAREHELI